MDKHSPTPGEVVVPTTFSHQSIVLTIHSRLPNDRFLELTLKKGENQESVWLSGPRLTKLIEELTVLTRWFG